LESFVPLPSVLLHGNLQEHYRDDIQKTASLIDRDLRAWLAGSWVMNFLNLGCGGRFHPAWTNVDFVYAWGVIAHDLTQGISFADSFDVVYHSHLLEHFPKTAAESFFEGVLPRLRPKVSWELWFQIWSRLPNLFNSTWTSQLFPGGQLRVDCTEMYDQTVRTQSGGEAICLKHLVNEKIYYRALRHWRKTWLQLGVNTNNNQSAPVPNQPNLIEADTTPLSIELLIKNLLDKEYSALVGRFRQSGEVHQWMYDRYSLALLEMRSRKYHSAPKCWVYSNFNLDTEPDGTFTSPTLYWLLASTWI